MPENNRSREEKLRDSLKHIMEDIKQLDKEVGEAGEEVKETGEDVEEIKEDIEEIKEDIGTLTKTVTKGKSFVSKVATTVLPDKFAFKDIAQQIVGAAILSAPFAVTEEVWNLANNLDIGHIIALIIVTLTFDILLFYYTKYQKIEGRKFLKAFPARILSIIIVTYTTSFLILTVLGVIGGQVVSPIWAVKLIVLVGLFANIGAGTADLIR
jgi:uncharacterized membrane protein